MTFAESDVNITNIDMNYTENDINSAKYDIIFTNLRKLESKPG